jgi:hypothetical protein
MEALPHDDRVVAQEGARPIAPVLTDLARRAVDLKGYAYFMNASLAGICRVPENAWLAGVDAPDHGFVIVILVEHERVPEPENLAHDWVGPAVGEVADMRAAEALGSATAMVQNTPRKRVNQRTM